MIIRDHLPLLGSHPGELIVRAQAFRESRMLEACQVDKGALVGMGAVVLREAVVGAGALVAAGAVVGERARVEPAVIALGVPARSTRRLEGDVAERVVNGGQRYRALGARYREEEYERSVAGRITVPVAAEGWSAIPVGRQHSVLKP